LQKGASRRIGTSTEIRAAAFAQSEMKPSVTRWLKSIGDAVTSDEPLLRVVTSNGTVEITVPVTGVLPQVRSTDGQFVQANAVLGTITEY
jgi:2-oxoglutarate dehydrogenase E2 component (dihydrolipoamide succinyltransferase)